MSIVQKLGLERPVIQAPMAGVSTPALAAVVSEAGGLGSLALGASEAGAARAMIAELRAATGRPFNLNFFCHRPATPDPAREAGWTRTLVPLFAEFGAAPPQTLREIYRSFLVDEEMLSLLLAERPAVASFHFGLPSEQQVRAMKGAGILLLASATSLAEAEAAQASGMDAVVAQGFEAGGHRGVFDPDAPDARLGTMDLVRLCVPTLSIPVVAAGGIMDGAGIAAALSLGAVAAQLGTAFLACPESGADSVYRALLDGPAAERTVMTRAISGRPARCLANRFALWGEAVAPSIVPDYPIAYDAGKALNAAARAAGEGGFGAHWAGQGAPRCRALPARELMAALARELEASKS